MKANQKAVITGLITMLIVFGVIFLVITASRKAIEDSKVPMVEKYYQNLSVNAPRQMVIASRPFKITNGMWAYLTYNGTVGTDLSKLNFFTTVYAPVGKLSVGDTIQAVKFHGSDNYGYFYIK